MKIRYWRKWATQISFPLLLLGLVDLLTMLFIARQWDTVTIGELWQVQRVPPMDLEQILLIVTLIFYFRELSFAILLTFVYQEGRVPIYSYRIPSALKRVLELLKPTLLFVFLSELCRSLIVMVLFDTTLMDWGITLLQALLIITVRSLLILLLTELTATLALDPILLSILVVIVLHITSIIRPKWFLYWYTWGSDVAPRLVVLVLTGCVSVLGLVQREKRARYL